MESPGLSIQEGEQDGRKTLVLAGELDLATAPDLEARVEQLLTDGRAVVLDLRELSFIDSTGLRSILRVRELCSERGCEFLLIRGPRAVQRLFELTGLMTELPFLDAP